MRFLSQPELPPWPWAQALPHWGSIYSMAGPWTRRPHPTSSHATRPVRISTRGRLTLNTTQARTGARVAGRLTGRLTMSTTQGTGQEMARVAGPVTPDRVTLDPVIQARPGLVQAAASRELDREEEEQARNRQVRRKAISEAGKYRAFMADRRQVPVRSAAADPRSRSSRTIPTISPARAASDQTISSPRFKHSLTRFT